MDSSWRLKQQSLVMLSALIAACAFLMPQYCAELIFIFLIPLFYALILYPHSFSYKNGFLWGIIFYSLFFFDIYILIFYKGHGWSRGVAIAFLILYAAGSCAIWFEITNRISKIFFTVETALQAILVWWGVSIAFYFYFIDTYFFWIFGVIEGNQLNNLLIPLTIRIQWLYFLPFLGKNCLILVIILFSIATTLVIAQLSYKKALTSIMCCLFLFSVGWIPNLQKKTIPPWLQYIGCIRAHTDDHDPWNAAEHIMNLLNEFQNKFPTISCVVMPESSFKFPLNKFARCTSLWHSSTITTLIIGSHRKEGDCLFNTLYAINQEMITNYYDKRHAVFFTERVSPPWSYFSGATQLFLKNKVPFERSQKNRTPFSLGNLSSVIPLICSDLFFSGDCLPKKSLFLCVVNDSWFYSAYIPQLMYLHAKMTALCSQSGIIYVGYHYCVFISPEGNEEFLPSIE